MIESWIKIYRKIEQHWIFKNADYLKAWITILMTVNFEDKKTLIQGEIIECKRGQSALSLLSWTKIFGKNWSIQKTRTFLKLLQNDSMINMEGLHKTTRLTVCNYKSYQGCQQADNTQITRKQHADNTQITSTKEYKNNKNNKNNKVTKVTLTTKLKTIFLDFYKKNYDIDYYFDVKNISALKQLGEKLKTFAKNKGLPETDEQIEISFKLILENITDKWILDNFNPAIINSKINDIVKNIRNGKSNKQGCSTFDAVNIMVGK